VSAEVDWVLQRIKDYYGYGAFPYGSDGFGEAPPLERVDRDDSKLLEGNIRSRSSDLQRHNIVGATLADRVRDPIGAEYDHAVEAVVGLRIEGAHVSEYGYVDGDNEQAPSFENLRTAILDALLQERHYPGANPPGITYHTLTIENETPDSGQYADYFRYDADIVFRGYEDIPS